MRILFVENHAQFAQTVVPAFLAAHDVQVVPSLAAARSALAGAQFDALLVDYDLDDGKGDVLVRDLRAEGSAVLVVAVSSHAAGNAAFVAAGADGECGKLEMAQISRTLDALRGGRP